jgi:hypothetical protein
MLDPAISQILSVNFFTLCQSYRGTIVRVKKKHVGATCQSLQREMSKSRRGWTTYVPFVIRRDPLTDT